MRGVEYLFATQALVCALCGDNLQAQVVWQQSQSVQIQLGVRAKEGNQQGYEGRVIVTTPRGGQVEARLQGNGDQWSYVTFPNDFNTFAQQGDYSWVAIVNGGQIAGGRFVYDIGGVRVTSDMPPQSGSASPSLTETQIVAAMKSDLRNLVTAEEAFFVDSVKYTTKIGQPGGVGYAVTDANTLPRILLTRDGWRATISNPHTRTICAIFIGSTPEPPAMKEGAPTCR